jgi:hypothetical protein
VARPAAARGAVPFMALVVVGYAVLGIVLILR